MVQPRLQLLGSVFALVVMSTACGEAPPDGKVDAGKKISTQFVDAGPRDSSTLDAGIDACGFMWADAGSGYDAGWIWQNSDGGLDGGDAGCQMTMCLTGAVTRGGSNTPFDVICDDPAVPNVIRSCDALSCYNTFNTFLIDARGALYSKLFAAMDNNGDGVVNSQDNACTVNLLGYSWGGIAAVQIAEKLGKDTRVDDRHRRVNRLFVMDPYQPAATLLVPTNVERFVEYRHSNSPANDCSRGGALGNIGGPFEGIQPRCYANQSCFDYDYSVSPSTLFPANGGGYYGSEVGHCEVPAVAAPAILADFKGQSYTSIPPQMPILTP